MPRDELFRYVCRQLANLFPDQAKVDEELSVGFDRALERLQLCMSKVKFWRDRGFRPLHSEQNAVFLCYLATSLFQAKCSRAICEKIFYLNKSLNGFHCFYTTELPDVFSIGHSVGTVLVSMRYQSYMGLSQCTTVGRDGDNYPILNEGLILFPGSGIIGKCNIGPRTIVSANTMIINQDVPGDCVVTQVGEKLVFRKPRRDLFSELYVI